MKKIDLRGYSVFPILCSVLFFSLIIHPVSAQQTERPYWFTLERGKRFFRNGDYGYALMAFEDARRERREMYSVMEKDMIELLSLPEVRRMNDNLYQIEAYINERYQPKAQRVLRELYHRVPKDKLQGSAKRILDELNRLKEYPEAEYWIGEVYQVEGELNLALAQYQKAHEKRELLENPAFDTEILYKMMDIYRVMVQYVKDERGREILTSQYRKMENTAKEIFRLDTISFDKSGPYAWDVVVRILDKADADGINQFLSVYRYNNPYTEKAHRMLGFQSLDDGHDRLPAENLLYAFLIQNSVLIDEVLRAQPTYTFSSLDRLFQEITRMPELQAYIDEVEYFKTIYYLGNSFNVLGNRTAAYRLWNFLGRRGEAGEWRSRALNKIRDPSVDRPGVNP
jgi:hypothetical protein